MDSMHFIKRSAVWWLRFKDHQGHGRAIRCTKDRRVSESIARRIGQLVDCNLAGVGIPDDLAEWVVHKLDERRRNRLIAWGLINASRLAGGADIQTQIGDWADGIRNRGRAARYADLKEGRAKRLLVDWCGWRQLREIDIEMVLYHVRDKRSEIDQNGVQVWSDRTLGHYMAAAKQFTRWASKSGRCGHDPLAALPVSWGKPKRSRRALSIDEQTTLIKSVTEKGNTVYGVPAAERALIYRVALGTGLRAGSIGRLTAKDVNKKHAMLMAAGSGANNKRSSPKPLTPPLLADLIEHARHKLPDADLFQVPSEWAWGRMVRLDASGAGIDTTSLDFHALRHSFGTTMAQAGVHPRTLMSLMDHGSIQMTMRFYTHSLPEDEAAAVAKLPDLTKAPVAKKAAQENVP